VSLASSLRRALVDPRVRDLDADSTDFSLAHRDVLMSKPMVRQLFERFYRECSYLDRRLFGDCPGARIEIGAGSSFMRELYPDVVASDIKPLPFVDLVFNAQALPFRDRSLRCIYAINTFHHLSDPRAFFRELLRVIHPGGGVIMIEPYYGPVARQLFKRLHTTEGFEEDVPSWEAPPDAGPFSKANQALSYVIFERDRQTFEREFPELHIVAERPHTHLWYLLSGGVNFRQLVPDAAIPLVRQAERILRPANPVLALQHTLVLRRA
jgi:SAM-dependent methyltransferase